MLFLNYNSASGNCISVWKNIFAHISIDFQLLNTRKLRFLCMVRNICQYRN